MKKIGIIESCMRYHRIMLLVVGLLVLLGIYGLAVMPKQEFPPFTIRQGLIVGVYPGATSEEVEEQLAKPLERFMFTYKEVKKAKTYTMSQDGIVYMMVELNDDVHNKDEVWSKIKHGVADFKMQLPSGVLALVVNDDFGDTSALLISLQSEDKTYRELQNYLDDLEGRLRRIESVSNLRRYGLQNEQITVYFDPDKLAVYGLDQRLLMARLFAQGFTTTGGSVENSGQELPIHFTPSYDSEYEIAEQIVYSDPHGNVIRLKDIARIVREYDDPDSYVTNNGRKAVIHPGVVIGAVENRYDHFVGDGEANEGQIKFEDVVQLGRKHNLTVGKCSFEVFDAFVDMFEKNGIIARRVERMEGVTGSDERVPERVLVRAHAGKLPRAGVELAVQPKMAVGLHARKGVPEMGRELPRNERVVGILMSFMGCLLKERTVRLSGNSWGKG